MFSVPAESPSSSSAMREETLSLKEAQLMGYHVNATGTRIILRCSYAAPHAYVLQVAPRSGLLLECCPAWLRSGPHARFTHLLLCTHFQEKGVVLEVISATVFYRHQWTLVMVDTSLACGMRTFTTRGRSLLNGCSGSVSAVMF